ncbi:uncharacterized protein N7498_003283 [Penicillium cinerascens]|uniref:Uncharacterized protein n=1 Tax=Penicillium cinerascens TaxID=70096 RepID=A0A9W9T6S0_9EURO|nr:uncharacterized protein N7498_003283 [Penicillium cinerascens]KAJ5211637.1 hypothetical protein N7498_003283 [Penicillium cinerascens]
MPAPMPPPPGYSEGPEQMQQWLQAKTEDDRRSQEEEKTRQEALKLEQRKVEQAILADSLRAGVPPHMLPLLFTGMCAGNAISNSTQDMIQQSTVQTSRTESPRSRFQPAFPDPGISTTFSPLAQHPAGSQRDLPVNTAQNVPAGAGNSPSHSATTGILKPVGHLARSVEVPGQALTPPNFPSIPHASASQQQQQQQQQQNAAIRNDSRARRSSPSISFHHWIPPQAHMQADGQITSSRKRKSSYPHHQVPPPSTHSSDTPARIVSSDIKGYIGEISRISPRSPRQRHQSDMSSSYESREVDYPGQTATVEQTAAGLLHRKEQERCRGFKHEEDRRSPDREAQNQPSQTLTSDNENLSTPSLGTGVSTRSGGTSNRDRH